MIYITVKKPKAKAVKYGFQTVEEAKKFMDKLVKEATK